MAHVMLVAERPTDLAPLEALLATDPNPEEVTRLEPRQVAGAGAGAAAVERLDADAVVVDVSAGMDPWEALPRLRAALPRALIVVVSERPDPLTLLHVIEAGADCYLDRSAPGDVVRVLSELLAHRAGIAA